MVILSSTLRGRVLRFQTPALPPNALVIATLSGREAISQPYSFELELISTNLEIDFAGILSRPVALGIKQGVEVRGSRSRGIMTHKIHGVLSEFEQGERGGDWVAYRATVVPRLWRLSLGQNSRVFLDRTVPQIVEEILKDHGFGPEDFEFRTTRDYAKREYVVQYQESDLDFVSRWLEHEGIYYFFKQDDEREKIVFGDSPAALDPVLGEETVAYRPQGPADWFLAESIRDWHGRFRLTPKEVVLRDYNWRTPSQDLKVSSDVAPCSWGTVYAYGDHYKDPAEGETIARVRAEELACRQKTYHGVGSGKGFRAGVTFRMTDHYRRDFNARYLITEIRHRAKQAMTLGGPAAPVASYENEFTAIPADVPFRPARLTPKPRIVGTLNAKVDAAGGGEYAEIDDQGRYKVKMPFDLSDRKSGTASRFVRMAQPYAGADMGMHFPLHKDTEVILTHIDGDPDRPIISGAVPNPATGGPVTGGNPTQCAIKSGGGNQLVLEDANGSQRVTLTTPGAGGSRISLGAGFNPEPGFSIMTPQHFTKDIGGDHKDAITGNETRTITGKTAWTHKGAHQAQYMKGREELCLLSKGETVLGLHTETIAGAHLKTVVAVILEVGLAARFDSVAGPHVMDNGAHKITVKTIHSVDAGAAIVQKAPQIHAKGGTLVNLAAPNVKIGGTSRIVASSGGTKLKLDPNSALVESAKVTIESKGALTLNGQKGSIRTSGAMGIKGNFVGIQSEEKLNMKAAGIFMNGSTVKVSDGKLEVNGNQLTVS